MALLAIVGTFVEYGTTARAARWFGNGQRDRAIDEGVQASYLAIGIGLVVVVVGQLFAGPAGRLLTGSSTRLHDPGRAVVPDRAVRHADGAARARRQRLDARHPADPRPGRDRAGGERTLRRGVSPARLPLRAGPGRLGVGQRRRTGRRGRPVPACAATRGRRVGRCPDPGRRDHAGAARAGSRPDRAGRGVPGRVHGGGRRRGPDGHRPDRGAPDRDAAVGVHRPAARLVRDRRAVAGRRRARREQRRVAARRLARAGGRAGAPAPGRRSPLSTPPAGG